MGLCGKTKIAYESMAFSAPRLKEASRRNASVPPGHRWSVCPSRRHQKTEMKVMVDHATRELRLSTLEAWTRRQTSNAGEA